MLLVSVRYTLLTQPVPRVTNFLHCDSLEKWIFQKQILETAQVIRFIMLSVSLACSARLWCVQSIENFALPGSLEKSIFQKLLETPQTIGFITLVMSLVYFVRFRLVRCVA